MPPETRANTAIYLEMLMHIVVCGKSLMRRALVRFGASARAEGIDFQAYSFNHSVTGSSVSNAAGETSIPNA